ncbi:MAG: ABC transporter permease [bacterium]
MRDQTWLPAFSLWQREMVRFVRQRSRVTGSLLTPVLFWLLFGAGYGGSFRPAGSPESSSFEYFLPGTVVLIVLFTAIFANISIIEDRREGFLQGVLVAPVSRLAIVMGKVLGGATLAILQALLFLGVAVATRSAFSGGGPGLAGALEAAAALILLSMGITALGFVFAWRVDSVQAFHGVMNLLLMPMWALSGALFPAAGAATPIRILMAINPTTYGLAMLRHGLGRDATGGPTPALAAAVTVGFAVLAVTAAVLVASKRRKTA